MPLRETLSGYWQRAFKANFFRRWKKSWGRSANAIAIW